VFRNSEEGGQRVGADQNGIKVEKKESGAYVFHAAKNGLEFGNAKRHNVAVTICYYGIVD